MNTSEHSSTESQKAAPSLKKKVIQIVFGLGFLLFVAFTIYAMKTPGLRPVLIYPYEGAMIQTNDNNVNLGNIPTDSKVPYTFILYNIGGKQLHIACVEASCGCTATELEKNSVNPGKFTRLHVMLNTSIKLGKTVKTIDIYSNDAQHPVYQLSLMANVVGKKQTAHGRLEIKDRLVLFKDECAKCHVSKGIGKVGAELFASDCAMCHGEEAEGKSDVAPGLLDRDYHKPQVLAYVRSVITDGSSVNPEMPPFHKRHGGPLNDAEIDSLIHYLAFKSHQSNSSDR